MGRNIDLSGYEPAMPATGILWARLLVLGVAVTVVGAVISPLMFREAELTYLDIEPHTFIIDALSPQPPMDIPIDLYFDDDRRAAYQAGRGLKLVFKTLNHPDPQHADQIFDLPPAKSRNGDPAARRELVAAKAAELARMVSEFRRHIPIPRSIEIGVDVTEGTELIQQYVRQKLDELKVADMFASNPDPVRLLMFRLSGTSYRDYRLFNIDSPATLDERFQEAMRWLLRPTPKSQESSIATGLFNNLSVNSQIRRRLIYVFSDGMENSRNTVEFYNDLSLLLPPNRESTVRRIQQVQACLPMPDATVAWYIPPMMRLNVRNDEVVLRQVRDVWRDVFIRACGVPSDRVTIIY